SRIDIAHHAPIGTVIQLLMGKDPPRHLEQRLPLMRLQRRELWRAPGRSRDTDHARGRGGRTDDHQRSGLEELSSLHDGFSLWEGHLPHARICFTIAATTSGLFTRSGFPGIEALRPTAGPPCTMAVASVLSVTDFCHSRL